MRELKIRPITGTEIQVETPDCTITIRYDDKEKKTRVYRRMNYYNAPLEFMRNAEGF